jgi:amidohydrolase
MKLITRWILIFCFSFPCLALDTDILNHIRQKAEQYYSHAIQLRRELHKFPELCYQEKETSEFVSAYLKKLGLVVKTRIGGYGIKAILRGNRAKPVVAIRADMDALPIDEQTGFSFSSRNSGTMHACGHDAHMTNVLIAAKILSEMREKIPGTIVFIFQPCEEGPPPNQPGGAQAMIKENVLADPMVSAIFSLHVLPGIPVGTIGVRKGPIMANVASFYVTIIGKSSHGAFPHQGIDAIYVASSAIQQFQSLISRFRDPKEPAVLSVGKINGGVRVNVIAEKVQLEGTVRTFSFELQDKIAEGMEKILKGLKLAYGIHYQFIFSKDAPFVDNNPDLTDFLIPVFKQILGKSHVRIVKPMSIAEDFSYYSHQIPALYFFLGTGDTPPLHTPTFSIDEKILRIGPMLFAGATLAYLHDFNIQTDSE